MDDGEDQRNGRDGLVATALRRLHIGGGGRLSCNHSGGGSSGLQVEENKEGIGTTGSFHKQQLQGAQLLIVTTAYDHGTVWYAQLTIHTPSQGQI